MRTSAQGQYCISRWLAREAMLSWRTALTAFITILLSNKCLWIVGYIRQKIRFSHLTHCVPCIQCLIIMFLCLEIVWIKISLTTDCCGVKTISSWLCQRIMDLFVIDICSFSQGVFCFLLPRYTDLDQHELCLHALK